MPEGPRLRAPADASQRSHCLSARDGLRAARAGCRARSATLHTYEGLLSFCLPRSRLYGESL